MANSLSCRYLQTLLMVFLKTKYSVITKQIRNRIKIPIQHIKNEI